MDRKEKSESELAELGGDEMSPRNNPFLRDSFSSKVIRHLPTIEGVFGFSPVVLVVVDGIIDMLFGVSIIPYEYIDTRAFLLGTLGVIVVSAVVLSELKSSALGAQAYTRVGLAFSSLQMPRFNTTDILIRNYLNKKKRGESVTPILCFAVVELVMLLAFGCIVAMALYVAGFRSR